MRSLTITLLLLLAMLAPQALADEHGKAAGESASKMSSEEMQMARETDKHRRRVA